MASLKVFLSYNETKMGEQTAAGLKAALSTAHIDAIMARHSIAPGAKWEPTIRNYLEESSALICVATSGYSARPWCQQEVGWALGRHAPILWIQYEPNEEPCGFLASQQALMPDNADNHSDVATSIATWLAKNSNTRNDMAETLLNALENVESYEESRHVAKLLAKLNWLSTDEWSRVEKAAANNDQVRDAHIWTRDHFTPMAYQPTVLQWLNETLSIKTSTD
ncbi:toll/interleukin-1 receptor domain-containing protein [Actinomyces oris]|uniref:toll/interleukin-1 receptor domain-containing protein n=1 Tax=Actinomyces oris TaxID=544580 RepID=UPI0028E2E8DF|nr:toll/interleukin-1 receptor domain-containing protein [Actinomyces oris]